MIQIGLSLTARMYASVALKGGGTPPITPPVIPPITPPTAPVGSYYPAVPAVNVAAAAGSLQFPEGNWGPAAAARAGTIGYKGFLSQSKAGLTLPGSGTAQATFAIVRLPVDKRDGVHSTGIMGSNHQISATGNKFQLHLFDPDNTTAVIRNRFRMFRMGASGASISSLSAVWDEDAALVVEWCDGAGTWGLDWYSLIDGSRHAGEVATSGTVGANTVTTDFNIGAAGNFTSFTANIHPSWATGMPGNDRIRAWEGEIAAVGHVNGVAITPAQWGQIALGARLQDVLPPANVRFVREFNGTPASLSRPSWATGDATAPSVAVASTTAGVPSSMLVPGSSLRRQSAAQYALFDRTSAGMVYGLTRGQSERAVAFSGRASGPVELRVYEAGTGQVVRDWTAMPGYGDGAWSGTIALPESTGGWLFADVRLASAPEIVGFHRSEFGVGYKFIVMGQSQTAYALNSKTTRLALGAPMSGSLAGLAGVGSRADLGTASRRPLMGRIGSGNAAYGDGIVSFLNQFRQLKPKTPVMVIREAVPGTSMETLLDGVIGNSDRSWDDVTDKLNVYGRDVTAILWNWLMNEGSPTGSDVNRLMSAMFLPSGVGRKPRSMVSELVPGWTLGVLGGDRESLITGREGMRAARTAFAYDNDFTLGPVVSDYRIDNAGGPHPATQFTATGSSGYGPPASFDNGMARFMQRMAVMALQTIGMVPDAAVHPYYANAQMTADRTKILIDVIAVNGGTISSPAPRALRSWYLKEPGDTAYVTAAAKGATAVLNTDMTPPQVEITRASGIWPTGTFVQRMDDDEKRAAGDGAAEDAIHAGGIYESWASDPLGFGFPVVGTLDVQGRWRNLFDSVVALP